MLAARTTQKPGSHWLDHASPAAWRIVERDLGLVDLCRRCETVELWFDPEPNAQLMLIWLLDCLTAHGAD